MSERYPGWLTLFRCGRKAVKEVPHMKTAVRRALIFSYALVLVFGGLFLYGFQWLLFGWCESCGAWDSGLLNFLWNLYEVLFWVLGLGLVLIFGVFASVLFLPFFVESWIALVVAHFRQEVPSSSLSFFDARNIKRLFSGMGLVILSFFLGFVPLIGTALAWVLGAYALGREFCQPYLNWREDIEEPLPPPQKWRIGLWGMSATLWIFLPVVGWLVVPWWHVQLSLGFVYHQEKLRLKEKEGEI